MVFKLCLVGGMIIQPFEFDGIGLPFSSWFATEKAASDSKKPLAQESATVVRSLLGTSVAQAASEPEAPAAAPAPESRQNGLSREAAQRRQAELARKEQDLRTLEQELDERLMRLQELESRLKSMLADAEEVKSAKYRHLVDVLSNMKAKQAASVLETLDEKIAVKVLSGMRGRQAGEILTFVNPAKAARLSESLARIQLPFE